MMNRACRFIFLFVLVLPFALQGEESPTPPPAATISAQNRSAFDPAAATQAWLDTVAAEKRAKSDTYFEGGYWLILWNFLMGAAILIFLLASRTSARLRDFAEGTEGAKGANWGRIYRACCPNQLPGKKIVPNGEAIW
jgi:STE24 endopeptidase